MRALDSFSLDQWEPRPWLRRLLPVLLAVLVPVLAGHAQVDDGLDLDNPFDREKGAAVVHALEERSRILGRLLVDFSREYRRVAVERAAVARELIETQAEMDRQVIRVRDLTFEQLEALRDQIVEVRQRYDKLEVDSRRLLDGLRLLLLERDALDQRIAEIRAETPGFEEILSGVWEVTWLPAGTTGTFYLDQSGTLVTGQYRLGARRSGSLRGTFVGNKIQLERVDAERGRDAELEGFLDEEGGVIRGTWQSFEMVQGGLPHGQWVARRVR
ncbi:MAG: hypothetical protein Q9Q40_07370 [Acidobacteriota bacterium]|nr:hypothetical protein [Acidobacteriota bacterium]